MRRRRAICISHKMYRLGKGLYQIFNIRLSATTIDQVCSDCICCVLHLISERGWSGDSHPQRKRFRALDLLFFFLVWFDHLLSDTAHYRSLLQVEAIFLVLLRVISTDLCRRFGFFDHCHACVYLWDGTCTEQHLCAQICSGVPVFLHEPEVVHSVQSRIFEK